MCKKRLKNIISALLCIAFVLAFSVSAAAIDTKYEISAMNMSMKLQKDFAVITRDTQSADGVFSELGLDYDETMTAFKTANIYLQGQSSDRSLKITLTMISDENSKQVNNYSDLNDTQLKSVLDAFLSDKSYTDGVQTKHGGNIFFDLALTTTTSEKTIYAYQCNTVINGMNVNLTIQKDSTELTADEINIATNAADSMKFSSIDSSGPSFSLWRIILWIVIVAVLLATLLFLYRKYDEAKRRKLRERKRLHSIERADNKDEEESGVNEHTVAKKDNSKDDKQDQEYDFDDEPQLTFDEALGYDTEDYRERAATDLETFDIKVRKKREDSGMSYFEDSGNSINDRSSDYFEKYFKEPTESRSAFSRSLTAIGTEIKLVLRHIGYFFTNLYRSVSNIFSDKHKKN